MKYSMRQIGGVKDETVTVARGGGGGDTWRRTFWHDTRSLWCIECATHSWDTFQHKMPQIKVNVGWKDERHQQQQEKKAVVSTIRAKWMTFALHTVWPVTWKHELRYTNSESEERRRKKEREWDVVRNEHLKESRWDEKYRRHCDTNNNSNNRHIW